MQGEVHLGERDGALLLLHAVDGQLSGGGLAVALDELGALDEHAARPAGRVVDPAVERLDDLDDQPDDRVRREELAAEAALARGEVGEEVLVDQPERIAGQLARQRREQPEQLAEGGLLEPLVAARASTSRSSGLAALDRLHRIVDRLAEVLALGEGDQMRQPGFVRDEEHRPAPVVVGRYRAPGRGLGLELRRHLARIGARRRRGRSARAPGRDTPEASATSWPAARRRRPTGCGAPAPGPLPSFFAATLSHDVNLSP